MYTCILYLFRNNICAIVKYISIFMSLEVYSMFLEDFRPFKGLTAHMVAYALTL